MKKLLLLLFLFILTSAAHAQDATPEVTPEVTPETTPEATATRVPQSNEFPAPGSFTAEQRLDDLNRSYEIYIPQSFSMDSDPVPLVILLHGAGGTGAGFELFAGFDALSEQEGFIVIYPDSTLFGWNDNRPDPSQRIRDTLFIGRIINYFVENANVDPTRVYVGGFSRGGMLAYRLGCELPGMIAGVVSVASGIPRYMLPVCENPAPVSVLMIHGTEDAVIPYDGVQAYLSARESLEFWIEANGCETPADMTDSFDNLADDRTRIEIETYNQCENDTEATLISVIGGGHNWPGHPIPTTFDLGVTSREISAAEVMWEFFERHTLADIR